MTMLLRRFVHEDAAQDLIEYALLAAFISLAAIGALRALGPAINNLFQTVNNDLKVP